MSVFTLKIVAVVTMLLDHIGYAAGITALRCVGRLAFPIYAFLIGNGLRHTSSPGRYLGRLLLLALLSQIPYTLFLYDTVSLQKLNIFFTLALGLAALLALERCPSPAGKLLVCGAALALVLGLESVAPLDYGPRGVLLIVALYYCTGPIATTAVFALVYYLPLWETLLLQQSPPMGQWRSLWALLALPLLFCYNNQPGRSSKVLQWSFYLFYPVHLLVLKFLL